MDPSLQNNVVTPLRKRRGCAVTKGLLILLLQGVASFGSLFAEMTLLHREMFVSTGVMTADAPGENFTQIVNALHQCAGGPRLAEGRAASADLRLTGSSACGKFSLGNTDFSKIFFGAWYFVKFSGTNSADWLTVTDQYGNPGPTIYTNNGQLGVGIKYRSWTPLPVDISNRWIYLGVAISQTGPGLGDVRFYYRFPGEQMHSVASLNQVNTGISSIGQLQAGCVGNNAKSHLRLGSPSVYSFEADDFSDIHYPEDILDPETELTWYCDPANGDDSNDGTSPSTAWKTVSKINEESRFTGMLPASGHSSGDTLIINTGDAMLDLNGESLEFQTAGLNVRAPEGQEWIKIKSYRSIPNDSWQPGPISKVYATTDTQPDIVLWEDDKFMHHPVGHTFDEVSAELASTPGSFWTDGSLLYVHPFGSTDPRTDGKRYERSYRFAGEAAVRMFAAHLNLRDIHAGKTCLAVPFDNDPVGSYCLRSGTALGQAVIRHCYLYYGSKHNLGLVTGGSGDYVIVDDVQCEQGSPYAGLGGQTVFVSYNRSSEALDITHSYRNCRTKANAGLIGSAEGVMNIQYPVFYSHTGIDGRLLDAFSKVEFINCDFGKGSLSGSGISSVELTDTKCGEVKFHADIAVDRCYMHGMAVATGDHSLLERNTAHKVSGKLISSLLASSADIQACTFDARAITAIQGGIFDSALFKRGTAIHFKFCNNAVLMPREPVLANVFSRFETTDLIEMRYNAYSLGGNTLHYQFRDDHGTHNYSLPEWKSLGFDENSLNLDELELNDGLPPPGSPLIDAGENLGPMKDITGRLFQKRNDIGAWETPPGTYGEWKRESFSVEELGYPNLVSENASFLGDGVSNLEKYFSGLDVRKHVTPEPLSLLKPAPGGGGSVEVSFERSRYRADLDVFIEQSTDLINWQPVSGGDEEITLLSDVVECVSHQFTPADVNRCFFRLKIGKSE